MGERCKMWLNSKISAYTLYSTISNFHSLFTTYKAISRPTLCTFNEILNMEDERAKSGNNGSWKFNVKQS